MSVAIFSAARARRVGLALGAVSAGLLALSACDKPTPLATLTVGTNSVNTGASCYEDGNAVKNAEIQPCLNKKAGKTVKVGMDDQVHFGVDPKIADHGWTLFINGQQAEPEPYKKTFRTIPGSAFFAPDSQTGTTPKSTEVSIVEANGQKLTGIWHFKLEKAS